MRRSLLAVPSAHLVSASSECWPTAAIAGSAPPASHQCSQHVALDTPTWTAQRRPSQPVPLPPSVPGPHRGTVSAQHILVCQAVASVISCAGATGRVSELLTLCGHGELSSGAFISKGPCCDSSVQLQVTWEEAENTRTKSRASQGNGTRPCLLEPKTKPHEPTSARGRSALGMTRASALRRVRELAAGKTALALTFFTLSFCLTLASSNLCFLGSFPPAIKKPHKPSVRVACHQCKGEVEGGVSERRELLLSAPGGRARRRLANSSGPHLTSCFNYSFCNSRRLYCNHKRTSEFVS